MSFMRELDKSAEYIWRESADSVFLTEMREGRLSAKKFREYIVQDSIYLRDYLKAYAMAIFKSRSLKEMQVFNTVLGFVNDSENATRLKYLEDFGMTDDDVEKTAKRPECEAYTKFLIDTAVNEDIPEILMAVMPCMFGYYDVFAMIRDAAPEIMDTYYGPLVADYTSEGYAANCDYWMDFADSVCEGIDGERLERLKRIYIEGSKHELYFWEMAGKDYE